MERYDEAEISWLRLLGTPDHVIDFLKTEDGLHTGRATRITIRTVLSIFAVFVLFELGGSRTRLAQHFPEVADAFLVWLDIGDLLLMFVTLLAGAACLTNLVCLIIGIGWRKAAGDLNIFAEHVGELWLGRPFFVYWWRLPLTLIMMLLLRTVPRDVPPVRFLNRLTIGRLLFWGTVTAMLLVNLNPRAEDHGFQVLNTSGYFGRNDIGVEQRDSWSELLRLEMACIGDGPRLELHFASGRSVNLNRMSAPSRMSYAAALAHVDDIRRSQAVPITWKDPSQQQLFRDSSAPLVRCVEDILRDFPVERRSAVLEELRR